MKKQIAMCIYIFTVVLFTTPVYGAQKPDLLAQVMQLDQQIFERGFNQCKLEELEVLIADDLLFYHDLAGTQNKSEFMQAIRANICSNPEHKPIRTLVPDSSQVFPLSKDGVLYGAIQQGQHRFHTRGRNAHGDTYTDARFSNVWIVRDGSWQLRIALSYDHVQKIFDEPEAISIDAILGTPANLIWTAWLYLQRVFSSPQQA